MPTKAKSFAQRNPHPKIDQRPPAAARGYDQRWANLRDYFITQVEQLCRICNRPGEIVHHVKEVTEAPDLRLDIRNLCTLCRECHGRVHAGEATVPPKELTLAPGFWG